MFFFFKQKTAYELRISDWSSCVCSSDLKPGIGHGTAEKSRRMPGADLDDPRRPVPTHQGISRHSIQRRKPILAKARRRRRRSEERRAGKERVSKCNSRW